jgi:hypothetical protein
MNMEFLTGWEYREWRVIGFWRTLYFSCRNLIVWSVSILVIGYRISEGDWGLWAEGRETPANLPLNILLMDKTKSWQQHFLANSTLAACKIFFRRCHVE